ncbi:ubiquitin-conjugating enzyme/RWD-like protein, partial [Paecilomyces variotii]
MRLELRFLLNFSSINPLDVNRGCTMAPIGDNIYEWRAVVEGPVNSPYEGGIFYIRIKIPRTYPMEPPQWKFETAIYHPNISKTSGEAVPGLLDLITQNRPWCADQTLLLWIVSIWKLLKKPSQDPMHVVEKDILLQLKSDRISFDRTARQWTSMYA